MDVKRYIVEVDLPDGLASIDCEVHDSNDLGKRIKFFLNFFTYELSDDVANKTDLTLRQELDLNFETEVNTARKDIKVFIKEILKEAYGERADIIVKDIDMD